jgi:PTS system ascorbate-specific IIA component
MTNAVLIIAHVPLAQALRQCALHVFPDAAPEIAALDVFSDMPLEQTMARARAALARLPGDGVLVLTDIVGATPCNVALRLASERTRLIAGVNMPMLLRALTYRTEPLAELVARAVAGGTQGIVPVEVPSAVTPSLESDAR